MENIRYVSPNENFGYSEKDLSDIKESEDYCCPFCGTEPPEGIYEVDGKKYPECYNEWLFSSDVGTTHDWDEVHVCHVCGKKFWFRNGCY